MPTGQVKGTTSMPSSRSISSIRSSGSLTSRSILLTKVRIGVLRARQTCSRRRVCGSTPLAASITISAASTAVSTRYVSSEKSWWPGVSSRLMTDARYSICITLEATEMPRCFSISIQSEVAWREAFLALTEPAIWIAPEKQQQLLGERRLARVRVGNDGEGAAAAHLGGEVGHGRREERAGDYRAAGTLGRCPRCPM
jgi:hypothetical protein